MAQFKVPCWNFPGCSEEYHEHFSLLDNEYVVFYDFTETIFLCS
jgi:hypothetical protein